MLRLRISLLSLAALCAVGMFSAAAASAEGPFWYTAGHVKLTQGSKGIKLQSKGPLTLKSTIAAGEVTITCENSVSEGTIDGNGTHQGQGKGVVTYTQCKAETSGGGTCEVVQPIKTNQLKAHLVIANFQGAEQIANLFEPAPSQQVENPLFVELKLTKCTNANFTNKYPVRGSVVGVIEPQEAEGQEGSVYFPETPITSAKHEEQLIKVGLKLGESSTAATFSGYYGARLQNKEAFGVFRT